MKETPIIMSGNHPKLVLDGIKTQTRRVIPPAKDARTAKYFAPELNNWPIDQGTGAKLKCPYGQVGDRLWVKETWKYLDRAHAKVAYKASLDTYTDGPFVRLGNWKPSIHMFKKDSRILLEITEVRVERVQDISESDCIAEGITDYDVKRPLDADDQSYDLCYADAYKRLWDSLNAKHGYGWEANPWVQVISFKEVKNATT